MTLSMHIIELPSLSSSHVFKTNYVSNAERVVQAELHELSHAPCPMIVVVVCQTLCRSQCIYLLYIAIPLLYTALKAISKQAGQQLQYMKMSKFLMPESTFKMSTNERAHYQKQKQINCLKL